MSFVNNDVGDEELSLIENDKGHRVKLDFKWLDINDLNDYDIDHHL